MRILQGPSSTTLEFESPADLAEVIAELTAMQLAKMKEPDRFAYRFVQATFVSGQREHTGTVNFRTEFAGEKK